MNKHEPENHSMSDSFDEKSKQLKFATYASVCTATLLIGIKLVAWMLTGSVGILASLVDSLMDSIASSINLLAVRYSLQPADGEHRFGHGKAEPLAGLAQAGFICGSAVFLVLHAIERLRHPQVLEEVGIGIIVMLISIVLTVGLLVIQHRVIKSTGSTAISADALHYAGDVLSNFSIIVALILSSFGFSWADPVFAIAVAAYILYSAWHIGYEAFHQLMDRELSREEQQLILKTALDHPQVRGVHDLRTRQSGQIKFIQLHLELDDHLQLMESHAIADEVEDSLVGIMPGSEVIVHQDPVSIAENIRFRDSAEAP